jgi:hypothetical protein
MLISVIIGWRFIFFRNDALRFIVLYLQQFLSSNDFHTENSKILIGGGKDGEKIGKINGGTYNLKDLSCSNSFIVFE